MREKIVARMQVPLAVLVPLLGVHAFLVGSVDKSRFDWSSFFFWLSLLISLFWTLRSGHLFFQVLSGHTYRFIPFLHELEKYRKNCIKEFKKNPDADKWLTEWVSITCKSHLMQHYIVCASHNSQLNADRSNRSWKAHTLLLRGALGTGLTALIFLVFDLKETTIHHRSRLNMRSPDGYQKTFFTVVRPLLIYRQGNTLSSKRSATSCLSFSCPKLSQTTKLTDTDSCALLYGVATAILR